MTARSSGSIDRGEDRTRLFTNEHHDFDDSRMLTAPTMSLTPSRLGKGMRMHSALENAFTHAPIGMALVDMAGRLLRVNDAMCRITGYTRVEVCARSLRDLSDPRDVDIDALQTVELLEGDVESYEVEKRYRHAWGHLVWVLLSVSLVRDDEGRPLYLIAQLQDISERKALEGRLEHLVDHDFLTALFNARYFERALAQETKSVARYGGGGAVLLLDLDHSRPSTTGSATKWATTCSRGLLRRFRAASVRRTFWHAWVVTSSG